MSEEHNYRTSLSWISEKKGTLSSPGLPDITVATPPDFPGGHPGIWSPEHLFVASAEVCLLTTFLAIAANSRLGFKSYTSEARGKVEKTEKGYAVTEITIAPTVQVNSESDRDRANRIIEKAHQHCLISNSMITVVRVEAEVVV